MPLEKILQPSRWRLFKRAVRFWWQRKTRGWDDSVTWSLDTEIANFVAPRLRRFRELTNGFPGGLSERAWNTMLDEMAWAFEFHASEEDGTDEEYKRAESGLKLFAEWFGHLWW